MEKKEYKATQAAKILGFTRDTLLHWEQIKAIPPARRDPRNNYRTYNEEEIIEIARLRGIPTLDFSDVE